MDKVVTLNGKEYVIKRWSWKEKNRFLAKWMGKIDPKTGQPQTEELREQYNNELILSAVKDLTPEQLDQMDWSVAEALLREAVAQNFMSREVRRDFLEPPRPAA